MRHPFGVLDSKEDFSILIITTESSLISLVTDSYYNCTEDSGPFFQRSLKEAIWKNGTYLKDI